MAGTIVVDRIESDASYTSTINVANKITFSNTVNFGVFAGTAPVAGFYLPTTNNLAFTTASTERMRIDPSGNVGIGTTSPAQTLHVKTSTSATPITLGVLSNATGLPALSFNGAYASTTMAGIYGNGATASNLYYEVPSGQSHFFGIADATKITINSSGNLQTIGTISVGNATPSTSGVGITFPATQSASSNANTLDDYEEGTWTPTLTSYSGSVTAYTSQGSYVKIGRIVFATVYAVVSNAGTASGAYIISNLPFSLATPLEVYGYGVNLLTNVGLVAFGYSATHLFCFTAAGAFPGGSGTYVTLNFNYSI
jgi:hypothetical protein